jgi:molecular chaperone GrpE
MDTKKQKTQEEDEIVEAQTEVSDEENPCSELEEKLVDSDNKYKRALADYQNLEKRVRDEKADWIKGANNNLLQRLLPLLDTLLLASTHSEDKTLHVVATMFTDVLKSEGVEKIETVGKHFDPNTMEAVEIIVGDDNIVMEERRAGYTLYGKLLRPAEVAVGGKKE